MYNDFLEEEVNNLNYHIVCTIKYKNSWYVLEAGEKLVKGLSNYRAYLSHDSFKTRELNNFLASKHLWNCSYNRTQNRKINQIMSTI